MRARRSSIFLGATGAGYSSMAPPRAAARADLLEQRDRALDAFDGRVDVGAPLETRRGFRLEAQLLARPADALRIEERALEHDGLRGVAHFRTAAAHDAGDRLRLVGVGDDQHLRIERAVDAVERRDALAWRRAADANFAARELVEIERVHRLAELEQHVVGDVDDVVDGAHAGRLQPRREPGGRGRDGDVGDRRGIARAQIRRFELDGDIVRGLSTAAASATSGFTGSE